MKILNNLKIILIVFVAFFISAQVLHPTFADALKKPIAIPSTEVGSSANIPEQEQKLLNSATTPLQKTKLPVKAESSAKEATTESSVAVVPIPPVFLMGAAAIFLILIAFIIIFHSSRKHKIKPVSQVLNAENTATIKPPDDISNAVISLLQHRIRK